MVYKKNDVKQQCEAYIEVEFLELPDKDVRAKILDALGEVFNCGCGVSTVHDKPKTIEILVASSDECGLDDDGYIDGGFDTEDEWLSYTREKITECLKKVGLSYIGTNTVDVSFKAKEELAADKEERLAYQRYLDKLDAPKGGHN